MKVHALLLSAAVSTGIFAALANPACSDPLSAVQSFTLADVKQAEAIYAANPTVPTYQAATQCLGFLDTTLSAAPAGSNTLTLAAPLGVASTVADLDVALNSTQTVPPVVYEFNAACGGYIEDLKAQAAKAAVGGISIFGLHL